MQNFYSNEQLLDGMRFNDTKVMTYIYQNYYPLIETILINRYKVSVEDAKDVFQESLIAMYEGAISNPPLKIQYSFIAYLTSICKWEMIKKFRNNKLQLVHYENENTLTLGIEPEILELLEKTERIKIFKTHFNEIGALCQRILKLFIEGLPIEEITTMLNFSSENYTRKRRTICKERLFTKIFSDRKLKELINGKPWTIREIPRW